MQRLNTVDADIGGEVGYHDRERAALASQDKLESWLNNLPTPDANDTLEEKIAKLERNKSDIEARIRLSSNARFTAAGAIQMLAYDAWKRKDNSTLQSLATLYFLLTSCCSYEQADKTATSQISNVNNRAGNSLFPQKLMDSRANLLGVY